MKLSISNIAWDPADDDKVFTLLNKYNFEGVDIAPSIVFGNILDISDLELNNFKNKISNYKFCIPGMQSLLYQKPKYNIFNEYRNKTISYLKKIVELAKKLDVKVLVFGSPKNRYIKDLTKKEANIKAISFFEEIADFSQKRDIIFCIEPNALEYNCNFINNTQEAIQIVKDVNSKGFGLHLDSAVMYLNKEDVLKSITDSINYLQHFHISEPFLKPITNGQVDHKKISGILKEINYNKWVSIEMKKVEANNMKNLELCLEYVAEIYNQ